MWATKLGKVTSNRVSMQRRRVHFARSVMYNEKNAGVYKHTRNQHHSITKFHSGRDERCCYRLRMQSILSRLFSAPYDSVRQYFHHSLCRACLRCVAISNRELPGGTRSRATNSTRVNFLHFSRALDKWRLILRHTEIFVFIRVKKKKKKIAETLCIHKWIESFSFERGDRVTICYRICKPASNFPLCFACARKPVWLQTLYSSNGSANGTKTRE